MTHHVSHLVFAPRPGAGYNCRGAGARYEQIRTRSAAGVVAGLRERLGRRAGCIRRARPGRGGRPPRKLMLRRLPARLEATPWRPAAAIWATLFLLPLAGGLVTAANLLCLRRPDKGLFALLTGLASLLFLLLVWSIQAPGQDY